jgi:UDP:flavonoid glycosyltransferase YjiC (YdhE family)
MDDKTDQPLVGRSVERAGAGRVLRRTSSVDLIGAAVGELLADGPHRAAAARLGALVRAGGGALGGALAVEGALAGRAHLYEG